MLPSNSAHSRRSRMVKRRTFLETAALATGAAFGRMPLPSGAAGPTIGIQVGAVSFVDEGTEKVIDLLAESAGVNTLFVASFTYGRGIAGRQPRGSPLPDHGVQEYDDAFRGGNFATPHPQLYRRTTIAPEKAPDHPGYDVLADVIPAAHRRRVKVIAWFEDVFRLDAPWFDRGVEADLRGRPTARACLRNRSTRALCLALVEH